MSGRIARIAALLLVIVALVVAYRLGVFAQLSAPKELARALVAASAWGWATFVVAFALLQPFGIPGTVFIAAASLIWP